MALLAGFGDKRLRGRRRTGWCVNIMDISKLAESFLSCDLSRRYGVADVLQCAQRVVFECSPSLFAVRAPRYA